MKRRILDKKEDKKDPRHDWSLEVLRYALTNSYRRFKTYPNLNLNMFIVVGCVWSSSVSLWICDVTVLKVRKGTGFVSAADLPSDDEEDCDLWFDFFFFNIYIYRKLLYRIGTSISQMQTFCFATIVSNLCDCQEEKEVTFDVSPKALAAVALGFVDVSLDVDLKHWQSFDITLFVSYRLQGHAGTWWRRESEGAHSFHFGSGQNFCNWPLLRSEKEQVL